MTVGDATGSCFLGTEDGNLIIIPGSHIMSSNTNTPIASPNHMKASDQTSMSPHSRMPVSSMHKKNPPGRLKHLAHTTEISCICVSADEKYVFTASGIGCVIVWRVPVESLSVYAIEEIEEDASKENQVAFTADDAIELLESENSVTDHSEPEVKAELESDKSLNSVSDKEETESKDEDQDAWLQNLVLVETDLINQLNDQVMF